jgi:HEAT repeat protein
MNATDVDRRWAEDVCVRLIAHPHFQVRGNAFTGLGHIARTCRALDLARVVPLMAAGLSDPDERVRGMAEDAAADLELYLGTEVPGYDGKTTQAILDAVNRLRREHGL